MFYFQLGNLVEAGVPLLSALTTLADQSESRRMRRVIRNMSSRIESGESLSEAMRRHEPLFRDLVLSMVQVGEASGSLGEVLRHVSEMEEARLVLSEKIKESLAYPAVLMVSSLAVVLLMVMWIVPAFAAVFQKSAIPLPLPTQLLYDFGSWLKALEWRLLVIIIGMLAVFWLLLLAGWFRYRWDLFWISVPGIGHLIQRIEMARWSRATSLMLASGVPILRAIEISRNVVQNEVIRKSLRNVHTAVQAGGKVADILGKHAHIPRDVVQMVSTGESSGTLDVMLAKMAVFYEQLVAKSLSRLVKMIEPSLVLLMGGVVGLIMLSIFLPIFDMIRIFSPK